jgi:choline dehydrogenase-like flavoprotein
MSKTMRPVTLTEFQEASLDYVIIGGGTAGLALAARLTNDPNITVGVLEAGEARLGDENIESIGGLAKMLHNPDYDWSFKTVPQVSRCYRLLSCC